MGFFSRKKPSPVNAAAALAAVASVNAHGSSPSQPSVEADREVRRIQKDMRKQAKAAEKERKQAAKRAVKIMKDQVKRARKDKKKQDQEAKRQTRIIRRMQKKEERTRRRLIRKRKKEEKRRRKQLAKQAKAARKQQQQQEDQAVEEMQHINPAEQVHDGMRRSTAPTFKESQRCLSCSSAFRRFPIRLRHHCRNCGDSFCNSCMSSVKRPIPWFKLPKPQKVCYSCDVTVFNGMGGAARNPAEESTSVPQSTSPENAGTAPVASPVRLSRTGSNPASESPTSSPTSRLRIKLRSRSRKDTTSSKSRRNSLWTLPIRPLLKRKQSRNRWDLDIHMEKAEMLARQRQALVLTVNNQPQFTPAS